jgi:hypothetical protein
MARATAITRIVLVAFVVFAVTPFVIAATRSSFWQPEHSMAPVATAIYLAVVAALVVGRYRWAWMLLGLFWAFVVVVWPFDSDRFAATHVLGFVAALATLALLVSTPMRRRLRRPVLTHKTVS